MGRCMLQVTLHQKFKHLWWSVLTPLLEMQLHVCLESALPHRLVVSLL